MDIQGKIILKRRAVYMSYAAYAYGYSSYIRHITHNSPNVYFLDFNMDFYYYYYGHYVPQGYFNPCESWIYRKDMLDFMQSLLNKHYYIVYNERAYNTLFDYVPYLKYNQSYQERERWLLSPMRISQLPAA